LHDRLLLTGLAAQAGQRIQPGVDFMRPCLADVA